MDWGVGEYELTARDLAPVAERVVARAGIQPGEAVLDLGAGTGNAAALAAQAGGVVTAVEPSARLLDVTRSRLPENATCVQGVAEDLPLPDASFDKAVSIFAIIFTPDPPAAARELVRVLKPGGRAFITTWVDAGTIVDIMSVFAKAIADTSPEPPAPRFGWGEPGTVKALFAEADVAVHEETVAFTAASPEGWIAQFETRHPIGASWRAQLEAAGVYAEVRAEAKAALEAGNEDPEALRASSRYLVVEIRPARR